MTSLSFFPSRHLQTRSKYRPIIRCANERQALFNRIAPVYDNLNNVLSLGQHRVWKRMAVSWSGAKKGDCVLDLCCGSGDLAFLLSEKIGIEGKVTGLDFSNDQLVVASSRQNLLGKACYKNIVWVEGDALDLPFPDLYFDAITIGYGLRNVVDKPKAMEEMFRVLKPGSKASVLDFNKSLHPLTTSVQEWMIDNVVVRVASGYGLAKEYRYLKSSISEFLTGKQLEKLALEVGFSDAKYYEVGGGLMGNLVVTRFLLILSLFSLSFADPRITEVATFCGTKHSPQNSTFVLEETDILTDLVQAQNWGSHTFGNNPKSYILSECMDDLSPADCLLCFSELRRILPQCLLSTNSARIYLDGCFLRYENYEFYGEFLDKEHDAVVCNSVKVVNVTLEKNLEIPEMAGQAVVQAISTATGNDGYGTSEVKIGMGSVYALAQCWKTVNASGCSDCLHKAGNDIRKFMRKVLAVVLAISSFSLLAMLGAFVGYTGPSKTSKDNHLLSIPLGRNNFIRLSSAAINSKLNFKYETLEKATDSFNPLKKLGEGGAGSVYKGTLPDGRTVAVKRLFFNTRQWVDDFFNEVNLIGDIQHKNLVKLLGCSLEGPESLLVYEYVQNSSLDQIMFRKSFDEPNCDFFDTHFDIPLIYCYRLLDLSENIENIFGRWSENIYLHADKNKGQTLTWQQRFDIIVGIAEGLAYLHGGSEMRIIHRDIKCSNILLDETLTAKIADFGLVRSFAADKTHLSTGIAGTFGYMAPEYIVRGQLTEKADVYSFGVLVIEIVCGRRNNVFMQDSGSILHTVWKHYKLKTAHECVDSCLREDLPVKEVLDVLQIGLLCTQASASLRPCMSEVVQMLNNKDFMIPSPKQPPFMNSSLINSESSTVSGSSSKKPTYTFSKSCRTNLETNGHIEP
ncbi:hypothetical protein GIB67_038172 [Kingdonia uniflora]|uniref:2-phytyl-1,4-beta-naphthoquinone methyltransferase, chloroplastic n=1 Tax=Kingdonia uniflora TaxID=39325 RepID=A0A7J7NH68_9MAGN|nr:hypothetical protein GIB67_038172 [Kingdonia uniflora]